jgi:hypothetical protein
MPYKKWYTILQVETKLCELMIMKTEQKLKKYEST